MSPEKSHEDSTPPKSDENKGMHPEFALRNAPELPIDIDHGIIDRAFDAGIKQQEDPENPANKPVLKADKIKLLSEAYAALAAGKSIQPDSGVTAIEFDNRSGELNVLNDPDEQQLAPIPLLDELARVETLDGQTKEQSYENVQLAHGLISYALGELADETASLSEKALISIQQDLQALREKTIHYPLSSGLTRYQTAGLLQAIEITITSDSVKAVLWENKNQLQKALDRLKQ